MTVMDVVNSIRLNKYPKDVRASDSKKAKGCFLCLMATPALSVYADSSCMIAEHIPWRIRSALTRRRRNNLMVLFPSPVIESRYGFVPCSIGIRYKHLAWISISVYSILTS